MPSITLRPTTNSTVGWTSAPDNVLNDDDDGTYAYDDTNADTTVTTIYNCSDTPADFGTMDSGLTVQVRLKEDTTDANMVWDDVSVRVVNGATILAASDVGGTTQSLGDPPDSTTVQAFPASPQAFGYVNGSADKTAWDGATVEISQTRNRTKGGATVQFWVTELTISGNYTVASTPVVALPGAASLTTTPSAPTVLAPRVQTPGAASLATTPSAPTVALPVVSAPGQVDLATTPSNPTVTATENRFPAPGAASLTITPSAPAVIYPQVILPGAASLSITPSAPDVAAPIATAPGAASLTTTPSAPDITLPVVAAPVAVSLTTTPSAPDVAAPVVATPGVLSLVTTPSAPDVSTGGPATALPGAAALVITMSAPLVVIPGGAAGGSGGSSRRRKVAYQTRRPPERQRKDRFDWDPETDDEEAMIGLLFGT